MKAFFSEKTLGGYKMFCEACLAEKYHLLVAHRLYDHCAKKELYE